MRRGETEGESWEEAGVVPGLPRATPCPHLWEGESTEAEGTEGCAEAEGTESCAEAEHNGIGATIAGPGEAGPGDGGHERLREMDRR